MFFGGMVLADNNEKQCIRHGIEAGITIENIQKLCK